MAAKTKKRNQITLKIEPELFDRMDKKRFDEDVTFQAVGAAMFRRWLEGEAVPLGPFEDLNEEETEKLMAYLTVIRQAKKKGEGATQLVDAIARAFSSWPDITA